MQGMGQLDAVTCVRLGVHGEIGVVQVGIGVGGACV